MSTPETESIQTPEPIGVPAFIRQLEEKPNLRRRLAELLASVQPESRRRRMSYEEFLDWANEDTLAEWVDGEVVMYSPASRRHQGIADFLTSVIRSFVEQHNLGVVLSAPFQMKLEHSGREPDLLFIANENLDRLRETHLEGPANLAVEIVSPESAGRDRGEKFYEYEAGGVSEYWLIDPQTERAEFYQLTTGGRYQRASPDTEGIYRSAVLPGFWLRVEWLWQDPLPPVLDLVRELSLI
ncbi:MAG: Uma2 family endonuclease [Chloroflexota bacterium]|nr:Uma2 family endonuclease [Chloroflexota bacterium]